MITHHELMQLLSEEDEVSLLEWLEITSEDILFRFEDVVERRYEFLLKELGEEEELY